MCDALFAVPHRTTGQISLRLLYMDAFSTQRLAPFARGWLAASTNDDSGRLTMSKGGADIFSWGPVDGFLSQGVSGRLRGSQTLRPIAIVGVWL